MRFTALLLVVVATSAVIGACDDDSGGTTGGAGTTVQAQGTAGTSAAGTTGTAGSGTAGTGAAGTGAPTQQFAAIEPCLAEADYVTGNAITVSPTTIAYSPACLKVAAGATITMGASTFHPLTGTDLGTAGNPIPEHQTSPATVSFPTPGFYSFECDTHSIVGMKGVVWVTP